ncbi:MAG: sugar ABC transporter permease [Lachnospiraceae bacterium]
MEEIQKKAKYSSSKKLNLRTFTMVAVLIILWILFTLLTSNGLKNFGNSFISTRNLSNLFRQMAIYGIMGSSMVLIIVTTGIDLSAGSVMGFIGCVAAALQVYYGVGTAPAIIVCILLGLAIYFVQGFIIAYGGLAPFIVTLGGQLVFKGMILAITNGATIAPLKSSLVAFGQSYITKTAGFIIGVLFSVILLFTEIRKQARKKKHGTLMDTKTMYIRWAAYTALIFLFLFIVNSYKGIPIPVVIMGCVVFVLTMIANKTTFGRSIYAIGGNLDAAKYAGIKVKRNLVMLYMIHGVAISIAGIILAARLNAGTTSAGKDMELDAIAAAVVGGASMSGGVGKVAGAILGATIMASIDNGMSMMNLDALWQYIVRGIIIVAAVWFDTYTNSRVKK